MKNLLKMIVLTSGLFLMNATASAGLIITDPFPSAASDRSTLRGDRFWNAGDYIQQLFTGTGLTATDAVSLVVPVVPNSLTGDTQDMDLLLNGTVVGSFMIAPGDTSVALDFSGFSVAGTGAGGDDYLIRLLTTRTVLSGRGSAGIGNSAEGVALNGAMHNVPEPGSIALLGLGLAALGFTRRRKV